MNRNSKHKIAHAWTRRTRRCSGPRPSGCGGSAGRACRRGVGSGPPAGSSGRWPRSRTNGVNANGAAFERHENCGDPCSADPFCPFSDDLDEVHVAEAAAGVRPLDGVHRPVEGGDSLLFRVNVYRLPRWLTCFVFMCLCCIALFCLMNTHNNNNQHTNLLIYIYIYIYIYSIYCIWLICACPLEGGDGDERPIISCLYNVI